MRPYSYMYYAPHRDGVLQEQPVQILGREEKELRNKTISLVKVLWRNHLVEEATWEREDQMRDQYPHLFHDTGPNFVDEIFL